MTKNKKTLNIIADYICVFAIVGIIQTALTFLLSFIFKDINQERLTFVVAVFVFSGMGYMYYSWILRAFNIRESIIFPLESIFSYINEEVPFFNVKAEEDYERNTKKFMFLVNILGSTSGVHIIILYLFRARTEGYIGLNLISLTLGVLFALLPVFYSVILKKGKII